MNRAKAAGAWACVAAAMAGADPSLAKVAFTGYADFAATGHEAFKIEGPPSALSGFGLGPETVETRGTTINSLGLFASTSLSDSTRLQMDVTYRNIGATTKTLSIQYANLDYSFDNDRFQAGKIMLPFGYYNQNRFYPFQRPSISGPVFISAILGLPQADLGAAARRTFDLGPTELNADVYAVNGYGPIAGSTTTFRSPALPGGLTIANNIAASNVTRKIAVGARLDLSLRERQESSLGTSYYRDEWNPTGRQLFQMAGAHIHVNAVGCELLSEYLFLSVKGDQGMEPNFGSRDWRTDGFFTELDFHQPRLRGNPLTPWIRFEDYLSRAYGGGGPHEGLWNLGAGAAWQAMESLIIKVEGGDLYYQLPFAAGNVTLRGYLFQVGATATF